jgi:hypothetical protein
VEEDPLRFFPQNGCREEAKNGTVKNGDNAAKGSAAANVTALPFAAGRGSSHSGASPG